MSIAFIYAGQGSQYVGMGQDLYEQEPVYKRTMDQLDVDGTIRELSYNADLETLSRTEHTQPCMVAFAIALTDTLHSYGISPDYTLGLSLGEYSALYAAGVLEAIQTMSLITFRGKVMATACEGVSCGMAAVIGLGRESLEEVCQKAQEHGVISIANYNCPGQLILSGEEAALSVASTLAKEAGARRVLPLRVSGAFHTSLMKEAGNKLQERFQQETFLVPKIPVIFNTTAKPLEENESISDLLVRQVQSSVYLEDSIHYLLEQGVTTFIEIGPGKVLSSFVKKIDSSVTIYQVENMDSLHNTIAQLKGE